MIPSQPFEDQGMPAYEEIVSVVIELIKPLAPPGRSVLDDTDLVTELEFDSLKVMNLMNILPEIRSVRDFTLRLAEILGKN
jgi:hypothetical protein